MAILGSMFLLIIGMIISDFCVPTWESDKLLEIASSMSFFNLIFHSIITIIYADDRCTGESSQIINYFRIEEDMLWVWFRYLIYQLIAIRIIGYIALYIQANNQQFNLKKFNGYFNKISYFHKINWSDGIDKREIKVYENNNVVLDINENENENENLLINSIEKLPNSLAIAWNNLSFSRKSLFNEKLILNNLRGTINFGTITALMGPSGAGKTTLLRCLNGIQSSALSNETEIYVNKTKKIKSVFIVQEHKHHLLMNLTVRESVMYSSMLKNNNFIIEQKKIHRLNGETESLETIALEQMEFNHKLNVKKILSELMLTNCADNKVSQCSGGEQKRLSIGLELTPRIKPNLICIDEPTTGLDSCAAEQVINYMNNFIN